MHMLHSLRGNAFLLGKCGPDYDNMFLRVQVPKIHRLTQNLYYNHNCPKPMYPIFGYIDPQGMTMCSGLGTQVTSFLTFHLNPVAANLATPAPLGY